jgi:hypothetical protein
VDLSAVAKKTVVVFGFEAAILSDTSEFANQMSGADLFKLLRLLILVLLVKLFRLFEGFRLFELILLFWIFEVFRRLKGGSGRFFFKLSMPFMSCGSGRELSRCGW